MHFYTLQNKKKNSHISSLSHDLMYIFYTYKVWCDHALFLKNLDNTLIDEWKR